MQSPRPIAIFAAILLIFPILTLPRTSDARQLDNANIKLSAGYRADEIDWSFAGNLAGTNPNIRSELQWTDLKSFQIMAKGKIAVKPSNLAFSLTVRGNLGYGWLLDGDNQDSDYNGDNRMLEFSRSNNQSDGDTLFDGSIGGGAGFSLATFPLTITPLIGWSYHEQNINISDGMQTVSVPPQTVPMGPFPGLNSTYNTQWYGPWIGVDLEYIPEPKWLYGCSVELHRATFESEMNWNLRTDLQHPVSMEQYADDGLGLVLAIDAEYALSQALSVSLNLNYQKWKVDDGTHTFYIVSGGQQPVHLNEVNWESYSVMLAMGLSF